MPEGDLLNETPSQTAGPYVHIGCVPNLCGVGGVYPEDLGVALTRASAKGQPVTIKGCIWDASDEPIADALIEVWQADASGLYAGNDPRGQADPNFNGWGRVVSDPESGEWSFDTLKPGSVPFADGRAQAPHITFWIVARGINTGLHTRMYFSDEDNSADPVLTGLEIQDRAQTLIASLMDDGTYRFDIRLRGEKETVFFDV